MRQKWPKVFSDFFRTKNKLETYEYVTAAEGYRCIMYAITAFVNRGRRGGRDDPDSTINTPNHETWAAGRATATANGVTTTVVIFTVVPSRRRLIRS